MDDELGGEQDKQVPQLPTVTLLGPHVNHTLAPAAGLNNSYEVFLSRHLPDRQLELHVR